MHKIWKPGAEHIFIKCYHQRFQSITRGSVKRSDIRKLKCWIVDMSRKIDVVVKRIEYHWTKTRMTLDIADQ